MYVKKIILGLCIGVIAQVSVASLPEKSLNSQFHCDVNKGLSIVNSNDENDIKKVNEMLLVCDKEVLSSLNLYMLHGLYERKQRHYQQAIIFFKKAIELASIDNLNPLLELAVTLEWSHQVKAALNTYEQVLHLHRDSRSALLGKARMLTAQLHLDSATNIYKDLLKHNPQDIDAMNGLAMTLIAKNDFVNAELYLRKAQKLDPKNQDTKAELKLLMHAKQFTVLPGAGTRVVLPICPYDEGLKLINERHVDFNKVKSIIKICDKKTKNLSQVMLLHGLFERKLKHYNSAIEWFRKAAYKSTLETKAQMLAELAVTYELNRQPAQAGYIYQYLLSRHEMMREASLGMARVYKSEYKFEQAKKIYENLLNKNPHDVDALNGLAQVYLINYQHIKAKQLLSQVKQINPYNREMLEGIAQLKNHPKYMVELLEGFYHLGSKSAVGSNLYLLDHLDATHTLTLQGIYNTEEIASSFIYLPTLLPQYSFGAGLQEAQHEKYSWGIGYQYLGYSQLPGQNWLSVNGSLTFPSYRLLTFGGFQDGLPKPWDTQYYYGGLTYLSPYPANVTFTTYYSTQNLTEFVRRGVFQGLTAAPWISDINTLAYSLDLSKEFSDKTFYDAGTSYSPSIPTWEMHGRLIYPVFQDQAIEAIGSYYFFNKSIFLNLGWRWYL